MKLFKFPQIQEEGPNFLGGAQATERLNYLVPPPVFQFSNF